MTRTARNERLKFIATALNSVAAATIMSGVVLPVVSVYFKVGPEIRDPSYLWYLIADCIFWVIPLYTIAYWNLGDLSD